MILKKNTKKLIAPIIITIVVVIYFIFYMTIGFKLYVLPFIMRAILVVVPLALMLVSIYMLYERIQEIKGGEEDDLSKY